ncbi:DUF2381 family protein [Hyalangium rubrum]|uniref:DUF2381 family protein n=1 Tax=Hyalangium rubrum TaxID=3103134 RepID=A0ABU5HIK6_9BACT|nr:DUF2381 family protein [Hyalangium sp. s54d21]MDY7232987.1 DUF2381 family protein [Hyalangium sp. s54d21]
MLLLLGGTLAQAQPAPTREPRRRSFTLTGSPLEARIGMGIRTYIVFAVSIRGKAVEVDPKRIRVVDTGEKSLIIEPLSEPRPGERWTLRVPLEDGKAPGVAEFSLVAHPSEVDTEIDVERPEESPTACPTCAPCAALSAADAIASGFIDSDGVGTRKFPSFTDAASGLQSRDGVTYRAKTWVLVDVEIITPPGHPAWRPTGATLTSKAGETRVRAVKVEPSKDDSRLVRVLVTTDVPPSSVGLELTLHLNGPEEAPSLSIPHVTLPPAKEPKP